MYGPKESEQRQTPLPTGHSRIRSESLRDDVASSSATRSDASPQSSRGQGSFGSGSPIARLRLLADVGADDILVWLRRGIGLIVAAIIICVAAALIYAVTTPPRYTVYTDILIDPSNLNVVRDDVFTSNPQRDAQLLEVESKLRVLTSRNVLARVIDRLDLTNDP